MHSALERYRREAIRAQHAAAHAYAWLSGRQFASRFDLQTDQAYVARLYERARTAAVNVAVLEHRS